MTTEILLAAFLALAGGIALGYWIVVRSLPGKLQASRAEGRGEAAPEIARLTERCSRYEESIADAGREIARQSDALASASARAAELERQNAQLTERVDALSKLEFKLSEALRGNESLSNDVTELREASARKESAASAAAESLLAMQKRVEELSNIERLIRASLSSRESELSNSQQDNARLRTELQSSNRSIDQLRNECEELQASLRTTSAEVIRLTAESTKLQATLNAERQSLEQVAAGREMLLTQFKALSAEVLDEKAKAFTEQNAKELAQLLSPMKDQFTACTNEFKEVNRIAGQERAALGEQFKSLVQQSQAVGLQAENLTKALKGDQKAQGTWGEIVLESLLELAGLVEGTHFECQQSFANEEEKSRSIPDVVLKLPGERHLVIDAKMSLTAYERASSSADAEEREANLKQHVGSVRTHIKTLAAKNYQDIYQLKSLDFVLLFVPVESAFAAAVSADNQLFRDAWEKNVIVVSPSTLLFVVRTVAYLWRQETQARNVRDIAKRGAALYDKLCGFVGDLEDVGKHLARSRSAYEDAFKKLRTGDGNVIRQAEMLRELGVKPAKKLPGALLGDDLAQTPTDAIDSQGPEVASATSSEEPVQESGS